MKIDLHTHSTYSDGTLEPEDLVLAASKCGITHMALCDHDSTGGLKTAETCAKDLKVTVMPGVEINTRESASIHILGYFVDQNDEGFQKTLQKHRETRIRRAELILERLQKMGIKISLSDFNHKGNGGAIGRPFIADKLKEKGIVFSRQEAFDKYLAQGRSAYVYYDGPSPQDAIDAILSAKGLPVVAHPGYHVSSETIASLAKTGLQGIETFYPSHSPEQVKNFIELAKRLDLAVTGGSDYHGPGSGHEGLGEIQVPEEIWEKLMERRQKLFRVSLI